MKKLLNACLLLTSLIGYLQWGGGNSAFLFEAEYDILFAANDKTDTFTHPFVFIPMLGQLLLLFTLFQKTPSRVLTYTGMACIGILLVFMCLIGLMAMNVKTVLSTLPFIICAILVIRNNRSSRKNRAV